MGVDLREISERTKIGMGYLSAIEDEQFDRLPAVVYVRGFLVQYARMLQLDEERVLATYLERYRRVRVEAENGH
jgi:flagellar biosynthesis protein FlhG